MRRGAPGWLVVFGLVLVGCTSEVDEPFDEDGGENLSEAYAELLDTEGKADGATCSGVRPPDNGDFGGRIALTFDDGPDLEKTARILEVLAAHDAPAAFFINGKRVRSEAHLQLLREMRDAGHILANHSQNHRNSQVVGADGWRSEVLATHEILNDVLGEIGEAPKFFRFPYGSANCDTYRVATDLGYQVAGWHVDSADWCFSSSQGGYGYCDPRTFRYVPDEYRNDFSGWMMSQVEANNGGIVLFHDTNRFTVEQLDAVLTTLEAAGYTYTRLDDVETFPLLNGVRPPRGPWVGDPCTEDADCDFAAAGTTGFCFGAGDGGAEGFCSLSCEGYCPDRDGTAPTFCIAAPTAGDGICVPKAHPLNESCAAVPGTMARETDRFVGSSGARPDRALVCAPE